MLVLPSNHLLGCSSEISPSSQPTKVQGVPPVAGGKAGGCRWLP